MITWDASKREEIIGWNVFIHVHNIIQQIYFALFYLDSLHLFSKSIKVSANLFHSRKNFLFYYLFQVENNVKIY